MTTRRPPRGPFAIAAVLLGAGAGAAHYHMLLPDPTAAARDQPVRVLYQWGHPFEHELFDADPPERVVVLAPDGTRTDATATLEKTTVPAAGGKTVAAYRFPLTPAGRGDYTLVATSPPVWLDDEKVFLRDTVKVVVHARTQNGWDRPAGEGFELVPLTRPYGLEPGTVFQAQALAGGRPLAGAEVEVERYNPTPPKNLPPDEHVTRRVKTDPNGVATCTLADPGWWCVASRRDGGKRDRDGKAYPVRERAIFWVFVDAKPR